MRVLIMGIVGIFLSATVACAATCTEQFSWKPTSGSDIAGYKIRYGLTNGGPYTNSVDIGNPAPVSGRIVTQVSNFTCGKYYYVVATAYKNSGEESGYSNQVGLLITAPGSEPYPVINSIIQN